MFENNKSYRLKCNKEQDEYLKINISQDFDFLDVLSLKITQEDVYKLYTSNYGVVIGRVLANDGFGIPNAKISIFIPNTSNDNTFGKNILYPYTSTSDKNNDNIRYNLLPHNKQAACYQNVGTMPSKMSVLDNDSELEVYNNFYKFTTTTNESGDYMFFGVPTGIQTIHVDIDLSDIGILSQTPRDMIYKGYNLKSFESPNKFKKSTNLDSLSQIISQDTTVFVYPFWGDETQGDIAISKKNINIQYKFEPTCVFLGSVFTDSIKSGISKNCKPSKTSGKMSELMSTQGTIEMIRKTTEGGVERFDINGGRVINNDGVWCYQIPMNLDYMITDEYGNLIPTDNPTIGIPTRTEVRFRVSIDDNGDSFTQSKTGVYLIPNNPKTNNLEDYEFNENCKDESFVNLFWNKVYSVKNYIPRLQTNTSSTTRNFLGLKSTNFHESNNPAPYNKLFIDLNLKFKILCLFSTILLDLIGVINRYIIYVLNYWVLGNSSELPLFSISKESFDGCTLLKDAEYYVPIYKGKNLPNYYNKREYLALTITNVYNKINGTDYSRSGDRDTIKVASTTNEFNDGLVFINIGGVKTNITATKIVSFELKSGYHSYDFNTYDDLTNDLKDCFETKLSSSSEVVNFDLTNDWINGSLYAPRFFTKTRFNRKTGKSQIKFCGSKTNYPNLHLVNTCAPAINVNATPPTLISNENTKCAKGECYEQSGNINVNFGNLLYNLSDDLFYYKSTIFSTKDLYYHPTDIILLGGLNEIDNDGIPKLHQLLPSTSFKMVDDTAEVETETIDVPIIEVTGQTLSNGYVNIVTYYSEDYPEYLDSKPTVGDTSIIYEEYFTYPGGQSGPAYYIWSGSTYSAINKNNYIVDQYGVVGFETTNTDIIITSGIDWGNKNEEIAGGLFVSIGCLNSTTLIKSCVNAERLCEIGVDFDENYDFIDYNGTTIVSKNVDGFISLDELSEGDSRGMFSTLNRNGLKTINNQYNLKKYDFTYNYPAGFDGKLSVDLLYDDTTIIHNFLTSDNKSSEYNKFRFGNENGGSYTYDTSHKLPRYENSFYFYFGLKQGSTAIDLFNTQYYVPCSDVEPDKFILTVSINKNESICPSEDGEILLNISKAILPYDIYVDNTLYLANINVDSFIVSGLTSGYHNITVEDGNKNKVNKSIYTLKQGMINFDYSVVNCGVIDSTDGIIIVNNIINCVNNKHFELYKNNTLIQSGDTAGNQISISNLSSGYYILSINEINCSTNSKTVTVFINYSYSLQFEDFIKQQIPPTYDYFAEFYNYVPQQIQQ